MTAKLTRHEARLLRDLQSTDTETRLDAALSLNGSPKPLIVAALREALQDPSSDVAEGAAQSLALVGDTEAADLVIAAAERSTAPWPRASLWAAVQLARNTKNDVDHIRVRNLLDIAEQAGPDGRQQATLLRPIVESEPNRATPRDIRER